MGLYVCKIKRLLSENMFMYMYLFYMVWKIIDEFIIVYGLLNNFCVIFVKECVLFKNKCVFFNKIC